MLRAALPVAVLCLLGCQPQPLERPNVLVFMVDTLRADALGCYGASRTETPHIDAFAAEGTRFDAALAQSSWTRASIGSVLTGEYPWAHGVLGRHDRLHPTGPTLAERLRDAGYRTGAMITNPNIDPAFGFGEGFETYRTLYRWQKKKWVVSDDLVAEAPEVIEAALEWVDEGRVPPGEEGTAAPFFLFMLVVDPHNPYTPPAPWDRHYDPTYTGKYTGSVAQTSPRTIASLSARDRFHMRALYDGLVSYVDVHFGRLLDALTERRLDDRTIVIFTSDHGEEFFDHGEWGHGTTLYDEQIHVPLIVRHPRGVPGRVVRGVVETRDLFPSILSWAGASVPESTDAADLGPCLTAPCAPREVALSTLHLDGRTEDVVQGPRYKLRHVRPARKRGEKAVLPGRWFVHDLHADPAESADFKADVPKTVQDYRMRLGRTRAESRARRTAARTSPPATAPGKPAGDVERALRALGYVE